MSCSKETKSEGSMVFRECERLGVELHNLSGEKDKIDIKLLINRVLFEIHRFVSLMDVGTVIQSVVDILCYNFVFNVDDRRALERWVSTYIKRALSRNRRFVHRERVAFEEKSVNFGQWTQAESQELVASIELECVRDVDKVVVDLERELKQRDQLVQDFEVLLTEKDRIDNDRKERGLKLYEAEVKISSLQCKLDKCSQRFSDNHSSRSLVKKKLKRREDRLALKEQEAESLRLHNSVLEVAKEELEERLVDLSQGLAQMEMEM